MSGSGGEVTRLLAHLQQGHPEAAKFFPFVYNDLRRLAGAYILLDCARPRFFGGLSGEEAAVARLKPG